MAIKLFQLCCTQTQNVDSDHDKNNEDTINTAQLQLDNTCDKSGNVKNLNQIEQWMYEANKINHMKFYDFINDFKKSFEIDIKEYNDRLDLISKGVVETIQNKLHCEQVVEDNKCQFDEMKTHSNNINTELHNTQTTLSQIQETISDSLKHFLKTAEREHGLIENKCDLQVRMQQESVKTSLRKEFLDSCDLLLQKYNRFNHTIRKNLSDLKQRREKLTIMAMKL